MTLFDRPGPLDGSDLWLFASQDQVVVCAFCKLSPRGGEEDFATRELDEMLRHVRDHREAGHRVPNWLSEHLRESWKTLPWMTKEGAR